MKATRKATSEKWDKNGVRIHNGNMTVAEVNQVKKIGRAIISLVHWNYLNDMEKEKKE